MSSPHALGRRLNICINLLLQVLPVQNSFCGGKSSPPANPTQRYEVLAGMHN
ncbi:hypothetical protein PF008_g6516 [Phytophthora fragariae]|uniref:Uncharacterized protein n=1 Tax=Phytophthora fragariae TaxID=53985 RepID=A0A6G0S6U4_9STRA|nr:hypothetical protein PF008_g6516 [Phytophthora fragariae]